MENSVRLFAIAAVLNSGCALMSTSAPRKGIQASEAPSCSADRGGMAADVLLALVWGGTSLALLGDSPGVALPFMALTGLHVASGVTGSKRAKQCDAARLAHRNWLAQREERDSKSVNARARTRTRARANAPTGTNAPTTKAVTPKTQPTRVPFPGTDNWREFWQEVNR